MATLVATQVTGKPWVRLDLDWSDNLDVQYVKIIRLAPGETYSTALNVGGTPIRLPAWGNTFDDARGTWTYLSNGTGVFYDTEAPMDVACTWLAVADVYLSAARDTYTRTVANNWGTADVGGTWVVTAAATQWQVASTLGTVQPSATGSDRFATLTLAGADRTVQADVRAAALPATGQHRLGVLGRHTDTSNHYMAEMTVSTAGIVTVRVTKRVAAAETVVGTSTSPYLYVAAAWWRIRVTIAGTRIQAKAWPVFNVAEPVGWMVDVTDASLAAGTLAGMFYRNETVVTTHVYSADNFRAYANATSATTLASSGSITLASDNTLWLTDPLRPAHDRALHLCPTGPSGCTQPTGIFFRSMEAFTRRADQQLIEVANRERSAAVTSTRKAPTSRLSVVSKTLADRDGVDTLITPGSPLLLRAPAVYGYPDRYLAVSDTQEERVSNDHRIPVRVWTLPWAETDAPPGPPEGVSESRYIDQTQYASWTLLVAAGHTWEDIVQGDAV
jgi:hypothetical protein